MVGQTAGNGPSDTTRFGVARLNADGSPDASFGHGTGAVSTQFTSAGGDVADAVAALPNGKLLVAGQAGGGTAGFAIARFNADGTLDKSFGSGATRGTGKVFRPIAGTFGSAAYALAVQPNGKILAAGAAYTSTLNSYSVVVRYNAGGSPDASFGSDGVATRDAEAIFESTYALAMQPDGKIDAAGAIGTALGTGLGVVRFIG